MSSRVAPPPGGHARAFQRAPADHLTALATHGDMVRFEMGRAPYRLVSDPGAIAEVLERQAGAFRKRRGKQLLGDGLLTSEGAWHDAQRALIRPAFCGGALTSLVPTVVATIEAHVAAWSDERPLDLDRALPELTLAIMGACLFGDDWGASAEAVAADLDIMLRLSNRIAHPWAWLLNVLPLPENLAALAAKRRLDRLVYALIAARRRQPARPDLLGMLLSHGMGDCATRDEALTMLLAGHETSGTALVWALDLLAAHPEEWAVVAAEARAAAGPLGVATLPALVSTRLAFREAMRLYPPAWALWRNVATPCQVGDVTLAAGETVVISPYVVQRDARWFPEPLRFLPARWLAGSRPRYAYLPFGGGPRGCVGEPLAWLIGTLTLAAVARRWDLCAIAGQDRTLEPLITLRPRHGLQVGLRAWSPEP